VENVSESTDAGVEHRNGLVTRDVNTVNAVPGSGQVRKAIADDKAEFISGLLNYGIDCVVYIIR
jgi:hypothetical protein